MTPDDTGLGGLLQLLSPALAAAAILVSHTCPEMDIASTASKSSELPCAAHVAGSDGITPSVDLQGTRCTMSGPAQTCFGGGPVRPPCKVSAETSCEGKTSSLPGMAEQRRLPGCQLG